MSPNNNNNNNINNNNGSAKVLAHYSKVKVRVSRVMVCRVRLMV